MSIDWYRGLPLGQAKAHIDAFADGFSKHTIEDLDAISVIVNATGVSYVPNIAYVSVRTMMRWADDGGPA